MQLTSSAILKKFGNDTGLSEEETEARRPRDVERSKRGEGGKCKVGDRRGDGGRKFVVLNDRSEKKGNVSPP